MALKLKKKEVLRGDSKWLDFDQDTKVLLSGTNNTEYRIAMERYARRVQRNDARFGEGEVGVVDGELTDLQNHTMLLAHFVLKDWKGVQDENGNELSYSTEAAAQLLEMNPDFLLFVLRKGKEIASESEKELDETLGKPSPDSNGSVTGQAAKSED